MPRLHRRLTFVLSSIHAVSSGSPKPSPTARNSRREASHRATPKPLRTRMRALQRLMRGLIDSFHGRASAGPTGTQTAEEVASQPADGR